MFEVFFEEDFSLLSVFGFFPFLKDVSDMIFKLIGMSDVNEFECVLNSDAPSSGNIIHKKLSQVEKVSGFKPSLIEDAAFVHECELVLIDGAIEVFIDLPNPLIDFRFAVIEVKLSQDSDDVFLIELIFWSGLR